MSSKEQSTGNVFNWKSSTLFYHKWGKGTKLMVAFHGYGQDGLAFKAITSEIEDHYTIVAIDLPYQGKTRWREPQALSGTELKELIQAFLAHFGHREKVSIMAYSIGGNYALGLAWQYPELIEELILIAADGLKFKPYFWFLTRTRLGRWLFGGFVNGPHLVFFFLWVMKVLHLYPKRVVSFFRNSISTRNQRAALMMRWISVSRILPKLDLVTEAINKHQIPVRLLFGRRDKVIPYTNALAFSKRIKDVKIEIPDQGHQLLKSQNADVLRGLLGD